LDCLRIQTCAPFTQSTSPSCPGTLSLLGKWLAAVEHLRQSCVMMTNTPFMLFQSLLWQTYPRWTLLIKGR
jgi:hypothetical protein